MSLAGTLESLAGRQLERGLGPLTRRLNHGRHRDERNLAAPAGTLAKRPGVEWWDGDGHWFAGGAPPRTHNRIMPLIDGKAYFAALTDELANAEAYVFIAGWCLTPHIPLRRDDQESILDAQLLGLLLDAAGRVPVRLLIWAGAPILIQPTRRAVRAVQREVDAEARRRGVDLAFVTDETARPSHRHHQKTIVIDGRVAFVGGMDITTFQGDRWDSPGHPLRSGVNWHDVQTQIEGETVTDVEANFRQRWSECSDERLPGGRLPVVDAGMTTPAQIVRTIPPRTYGFARDGEFGIHHALIGMISNATSLIYLENQYLWSPDVVDALCNVMRGPRGGQIRIVVVLPARAYSGKWDNDRRVNALRGADGGREMFDAYSLYASGPHLGVKPFRYRPIYVHAKVAVVDDEWASIGSANLNTRGLVTDSELNVLVHDPAVAKRIRVALWAEHLAMPVDHVERADPSALAATAWRDQAAENAEIIKRADALLHGQLHRYESGRMPGSAVLEEAESLTFEH